MSPLTKLFDCSLIQLPLPVSYSYEPLPLSIPFSYACRHPLFDFLKCSAGTLPCDYFQPALLYYNLHTYLWLYICSTFVSISSLCPCKVQFICISSEPQQQNYLRNQTHLQSLLFNFVYLISSFPLISWP